MKINLFVVITPLQLINAIEYKHQYASNENCKNYLFIVNYINNTKEQLQCLLNNNEWDDIVYLFSNRLNLNYRFFSFLHNSFLSLSDLYIYRFIYKLIKKKSVTNLIVGNYHNRVLYKLLQNVESEDKVVLDDGMNSTSITQRRREEFKEGKNHFFLRNNSLKKKIELKFFGLKHKIAPKGIIFFSSFIDRVDEGDFLERNTFPYFKSTQTKKTKENNTYFVGSPLVEVGVLKQNTYLDLLSKIKSFYNGEVVYIPHRLERHENVKKIESIFKVINLNQPFEVFLISSEVIPKRVASFYSAVLFTTNTLFGNTIEINSFVLPADKVMKMSAEKLRSIYDGIKQKSNISFKVISDY